MNEELRRTDFEEPSQGSQRRGAVLVTSGGVLVGMSLLVVWLIPDGIRDGSEFWLWWTLVLGGLGFTLIGIGARMQARRVP